MDKKSKELVQKLKARMESVEPLSEEPDFFSSEETLLRYLKAREWNLAEAEKQLKFTVEWRRTTKPLTSDCRWCHEKPGYHSIRQVGFDKQQRPVFYSSFTQAAVKKLSVEDSVAHVTYLLENGKVTMAPGVYSWVLVIDCTGMTLPSCNPKLGYGITQVMSTHYPERLGLAICVNHNPVFQGIWNAIKVFLPDATTAKMNLIRGKKKVRETFDKHFPEELKEWLLMEMKLNKQDPLSGSQRRFWEQPSPPEGASVEHDPRGCPSYVHGYIDTFTTRNSTCNEGALTHKPHPNVMDVLLGQMSQVQTTNPNSQSKHNQQHTGAESAEGESNSSDDSWDNIEELEITDEYAIPENAISIK